MSNETTIFPYTAVFVSCSLSWELPPLTHQALLPPLPCSCVTWGNSSYPFRSVFFSAKWTRWSRTQGVFSKVKVKALHPRQTVTTKCTQMPSAGSPSFVCVRSPLPVSQQNLSFLKIMIPPCSWTHSLGFSFSPPVIYLLLCLIPSISVPARWYQWVPQGSKVDLENLLVQKGPPPATAGFWPLDWTLAVTFWLFTPSCRQYPLSPGHCCPDQVPCASVSGYLLCRLPQVIPHGMWTLQAAPCWPSLASPNTRCFQVKSF